MTGDGIQGTEVRWGRHGVGRPGLGWPAGPGGAGPGPFPLPVPVPRPGGGGGSRVPSYQVTAGFASFSLARPQPISAQRRCSRAGGLETRAPSPDTGAARRGHTIAVALTHAHCPRDTPRCPPPRSYSDIHTVPKTRRHSITHIDSWQSWDTTRPGLTTTTTRSVTLLNRTYIQHRQETLC